MTRRPSAHLAVLLCLATVGLGVVPALGWASSGGGGLKGSGGTRSANGQVVASGDGMTIVTRASGFLHSSLRFTGSAPSDDAGATVRIERLGYETGWAWAPTASSRVRRDGSFVVTWTTNHIGRFSIRAVIGRAGGPRAAAASPTVTITVYRLAVATWYGPGEWDTQTACGETLRRNTLGVANRTLPCGTPVAIYYRGRTIVVPVIDRGPYGNADWDLTEATAHAIGVNDTATIGAVSLRHR